MRKLGQKTAGRNLDCMKSKILLPLLFLSGCAGQYGLTGNQQVHVVLDDLRMEVADLKHHLNGYHVEQSIAEEKLKNQQVALTSLKKQLENQAHVYEQITALENEILKLKTSQEKTLADLKKLGEHSNALTAALSTYREKTQECLDKLQRLGELNKTLDSISKAMHSSASKASVYRVRPGDSLGKIAETHHTTVEALKSNNQLTTDTIFVGQELKILQ